jgi:hypothetical protein
LAFPIALQLIADRILGAARARKVDLYLSV